MGLDTVELMMAAEERFDMEIPDEDTVLLSTVGDFHEYLCYRMRQQPRPPCRSQRAFYRVRRTLQRVADAPRWYVHPTTSLDTLLPAFPLPRRRLLRRLRHEFGIPLPDDATDATVAHLVRSILAREPKECGVPPGGWTRATIWNTLVELTARHLDVPPQRVIPEARFVEDLGAD